MKINDIKDLQKVIALCRKMGVEAMEIDTIKFNLAPQPKSGKVVKTTYTHNDMFPEANIKIPQFTPTTEEVAPNDSIATDELTEEQLMFYSATSNEEAVN